jgi:membrane protein YqaA with SNARE-associated domain
VPPSSLSLFDQILRHVPMLARLQDWVIALGKRRMALSWLMGLGFLESIIFPLPVDPLLAAIVMARPRHYLRLAVMTSTASTLGGVAGWGIGLGIALGIGGLGIGGLGIGELGIGGGLDEATTAAGWIGNASSFQTVAAKFTAHGWVLVLIGAFTPLPYKIIAVSAGFLGIGIIPFVLASMIGRTVRFVLVASIVRHRSDNKKAALLTAILVLLVVVFWRMVQ